MKLRLSFQGWVFCGCFLVVLCTLVLVGFISQHSIRNQLIENTRADLHGELRLAALLIKDRWPQDATKDKVDELANELGRITGSRVSLIGPGGVVLGDSQVERHKLADLDNHASRPEVVQALAGLAGSSIRYSATLGLDLMYAAITVEAPGKGLVVARLSLPLAQVEQSVDRIRQLMIWAMLLGLALSTVVAYLVSRGISRPVKELTATATAIAGGDLSQRYRRYPNHELGDLGRAFDHMADALQSEIETVRQGRDRRAAILRAMREGVLVTDAQGLVLLTNQALRRQLGLGADAAGLQAGESIRNTDLLEAITAVRSGKSHVIGEMRTLGQGRRVLEINAAGLGGDGPPQGCVAVLHDITELKRTEQVRRDFVANVSHELRTPLTAIAGSVETLLHGALDSPPDAKRFMEMIARQVVRLEHLVNDLLDLAAIESGQGVVDEERVTARELADSVLATARELAAGRDIQLTAQLADDDLSFWTGRQALEQALLNLLDNAIKYTADQGRVVLSINPEGDMVRISVSDNGPGIAPEHQPRIFERFYRVDKTRSRELGGTGLGLAIVKHTAGSLGGKVELVSSPGGGSTFSIIVPV